jgi:hypothetical protein
VQEEVAAAADLDPGVEEVLVEARREDEEERREGGGGSEDLVGMGRGV